MKMHTKDSASSFAVSGSQYQLKSYKEREELRDCLIRTQQLGPPVRRRNYRELPSHDVGA
jgi:hypothetical protein